MSFPGVPSGKLIDIDSSFEEIDDDPIGELSPTLQPTTKCNQATNVSPARVTDPHHHPQHLSHHDDDYDEITFPSPDSATYQSRWSRSGSVGGTILNDPAFKSDFNGDYRLWARLAEQQKKRSSSSLIVNLIDGSSGAAASSLEDKKSTYSLDQRLTSSSEQNLLLQKATSDSFDERDRPSSAGAPPDCSSVSSSSFSIGLLTGESQNPKKHKMSSKYNEWSMSSLPSASSLETKGGKIKTTYGETQRLVGGDGSSARLMAPDDEEYDSEGFTYGGRHVVNGTDDDEEGGGVSGKSSGGCPWSLYKGIFYSSMSSIFFSLSAVIVKYLKDIHPGQLAVCRFVGIFVLTIPLIVYHDLNPFGPPELRHLLVLRGLAGATSLYFRFVAFQNLPIADASVIIFSIPVFVSIFAWIFLKEPCGLFQSFTIIIAMVGLMMTTKLPFLFGGDSTLLVPSKTYYLYNTGPSRAGLAGNLSSLSSSLSSSNVTSFLGANQSSAAVHQVLHQLLQPPPPTTDKLNHFYGVLAAMSSLIFASAVFIFIRKAKGAHHAVIMFNFGWVAIIETTVITTFAQGFSLPANPFEWYLIVILGVFSFCGQILLTRSLQLEQAGPVSVVRATTDIALAFLWQMIIFRETPDLWSVFGALLVSSCILLTSARKWVLALPDHSRLKAKFYFLTL